MTSILNTDLTPWMDTWRQRIAFNEGYALEKKRSVRAAGAAAFTLGLDRHDAMRDYLQAAPETVAVDVPGEADDVGAVDDVGTVDDVGVINEGDYFDPTPDDPEDTEQVIEFTEEHEFIAGGDTRLSEIWNESDDRNLNSLDQPLGGADIFSGLNDPWSHD